MKRTEPSYYSVLPAEVRYHAKLSASAKLLFSEITALCNKGGTCWASNAYFARLYKAHTSTISGWIAELIQEGFIESYLEEKKRVLAIVKRRSLRENTTTPGQKDEGGMGEKAKQNNTSINIKVNTNSDWLKNAVKTYSLFWKDLYGTDFTVANWGRLGKTLLPLKSLSEWQWACLIWLHFNWRGASGSDDRAYNGLMESGFPLDWLPRASNLYKAYLINSLKVNWDDESAVKKFILPELKKVNYGTD